VPRRFQRSPGYRIGVPGYPEGAQESLGKAKAVKGGGGAVFPRCKKLFTPADRQTRATKTASKKKKKLRVLF